MKNFFTQKRSGIATILACYIVICFVPQLAYSQTKTIDCTGSTMYGIFNNSSTNTTQILPISYSAGTIGTAEGFNATLSNFTISKKLPNTAGGVTTYGSSAMAVSQVNSMFYLISGMGYAPNDGQKDLYAFNPAGNTAATSLIKIGSTVTPSLADSFFIVKMAVSPTNIGYMIGIDEDSVPGTSRLYSFTLCGTTPTTNCSVITDLGPIVNPTYSKWDLFNGDIAFDAFGNLFFVTVKYDPTSQTYQNARIFEITAANVPTTPVASIPLTFINNIGLLDGTAVNGAAFDNSGNLYIATRAATGTPPPSSLYKYPDPRFGAKITSFGTVPSGYTIGDLASCSFPFIALPLSVMDLSGQIAGSNVSLTWKSQSDDKINYFEIQRSTGDQDNFVTVGKVFGNSVQNSYSYFDNLSAINGKSFFYRIKQTDVNEKVIYSNVYNATINNNQTGSAIQQVYPNPFVSSVTANVQLQQDHLINIRLIDCAGQLIRSKSVDGKSGSNSVGLNDLGSIAPGVYILEINAGGESSRQKVLKN